MDWLKSANGRLGEIGSGLIESISWKLAAELHHQHQRALQIIECHPGGGQYDCISFVKDGAIVGELNRNGGFTGLGGRTHIPWKNLWPKAMTESGLRDTLEEMSRGCGLQAKATRRPPTAATQTYRVMAVVAMFLSYRKEHCEWRNGASDTSGGSDQSSRDQWFIDTGMEDELISAMHDEGHLVGRYRFWFLLKNREPKCCLTTAGQFWMPGKPPLDFMAHKNQRMGVAELAEMVLQAI